MNKILMLVLSALLLVACNDNDDDPIASTKAVAPPSPDSFTLNVKAELLQSTDDTEPKTIDTTVLVAIDDAEPIDIN